MRIASLVIVKRTFVVLALTLVVLVVGCAPSGTEQNKQEEKKPQESQTTPETTQEATREASRSERNTPPEKITASSQASQEKKKADEAPSSDYDATVTVKRVVDGDTVDISPAIDGIDRVRLIGVDTPETKDPDCGVQPYGDVTTSYTTSELQGEKVDLEFDEEKTDRYDRLLAYVYKDEEMFNEDLLEGGYAQVATFPPNVKYVDRFLAAQERARAAGLGIWSLSPEELAQLEDRGNGIGGAGCTEEAVQKSSAQPQPAPKSSPKPRPQPQPAPQSEPKQKAAPTGGDVDCSDFSSSSEAQSYLLPGDPYRLDRDGDGQACDSLR